MRKSPSEIWMKFAEFRDHFYKAQKLAQELCKDIGYSDMAGDFDDVVDGFAVQNLFDGIVERCGKPCASFPELEQYSSNFNPTTFGL